jgi:hypothetical protein
LCSMEYTTNYLAKLPRTSSPSCDSHWICLTDPFGCYSCGVAVRRFVSTPVANFSRPNQKIARGRQLYHFCVFATPGWKKSSSTTTLTIVLYCCARDFQIRTKFCTLCKVVLYSISFSMSSWSREFLAIQNTIQYSKIRAFQLPIRSIES